MPGASHRREASAFFVKCAAVKANKTKALLFIRTRTRRSRDETGVGVIVMVMSHFQTDRVCTRRGVSVMRCTVSTGTFYCSREELGPVA